MTEQMVGLRNTQKTGSIPKDADICAARLSISPHSAESAIMVNYSRDIEGSRI